MTESGEIGSEIIGKGLKEPHRKSRRPCIITHGEHFNLEI